MLMIAAAVFGIDTKASTTYQLFVLLLIVFAFSLLGSLYNTLKVTIDRKLPRYVTVGEPFSYQISIDNLSGKKYHNLVLIDQLAENPADIAKFINAGNVKKLSFISFQQWRRLLSEQRGGIIRELPIGCLPQQQLNCKNSVVPLRRGIIYFSGCYIAKPDFLGLFRRLVFVELKQYCFVLPKHYPVAAFKIQGSRKYQPGGISQANSVGESAEFMALREYRQGDPMHLVHWKSLARHSQLISKQYQDEYFVRRALVLDTFQGDASHAQFEAAISVAASLAIGERQNESLLDLMFAGTEAYCFTSGRGLDQLQHIREILASVQASHSDSFKLLQQKIQQYAFRCSSLIFVLLHWDDDRKQLIRQMRLADIPVIVFHVFEQSTAIPQTTEHEESFYLVDCSNIAESLAAL